MAVEDAPKPAPSATADDLSDLASHSNQSRKFDWQPPTTVQRGDVSTDQYLHNRGDSWL